MDCTFQEHGLYNHIVSQSPSWSPQAVHDFNVVENQAGFDASRTVVANYDGRHCFHHDSLGPYVPNIIVVRHETSTNGGALSLGNKLPTHRLVVTHNQLKNTGKDHKNNPLRNVVLRTGSTQKPAIEWNHNRYAKTACRDAYVWGSTSVGNLTAWSQATGFDKDSIETDPDSPAPAVPVVTPVAPPVTATPFTPPTPVASDPATVFLAAVQEAANPDISPEILGAPWRDGLTLYRVVV